MDKTTPIRFTAEITSHFSSILAKLAQNQNHAGSYSDLLFYWQQLHLAYLEPINKTLKTWAENYGSAEIIDKIKADSIVVEVVDQNTKTSSDAFFR